MKSPDNDIISWLMDGDPAIRYHVLKYIIIANQSQIQTERKRISKEGWGKQLLDLQDPKGTWANALYSPKWTSTTYSLLHLRHLGTEASQNIRKAVNILIDKGFYHDGGINFWKSWKNGEVCVTSMILALSIYFGIEDERNEKMLDFILNNEVPGGGWNCNSFKGEMHGSFHTTISALEALHEYEQTCGKRNEIQIARIRAIEFLLEHKLYQSHRTGETVDRKMLLFSFPPRWKYDVMRALYHFAKLDIKYDTRMDDAIEVFQKNRDKDGLWKLQNKHIGKTFFEMEKPGKPSRWNTFRGIVILNWLKSNGIYI